MKILAFCLLFVSACAFAQDAQVVELQPEDAAQARRLYDAKQAADKAWEDFYAGVKTKSRLGDITFSHDFRFAVPKQVPASGALTWSWPSSCFTANSTTTNTLGNAN